MKRLIIEDLIRWKSSKRRKPLLLTGVRQCGKTHILKEFGELYFENTCYINFEANEQYRSFFEFEYDTDRILKEIELIENSKIDVGKTLLIFDEIIEKFRSFMRDHWKSFIKNILLLEVCLKRSMNISLQEILPL